MNKKLHRVLDEIQKTEEKIAAWQEHLGELNVQREMLEDAEILKSVHSMRLGSWELLSVLEGISAGDGGIFREAGNRYGFWQRRKHGIGETGRISRKHDGNNGECGRNNRKHSRGVICRTGTAGGCGNGGRIYIMKDKIKNI